MVLYQENTTEADQGLLIAPKVFLQSLWRTAFICFINVLPLGQLSSCFLSPPTSSSLLTSGFSALGADRNYLSSSS